MRDLGSDALLGLPPALVVPAVLGATALGGWAARRPLGRLVAGCALMFARPYNPGEQVRLYAPELHAEVDAEIVRVGLARTTLTTASGPLVVSNSRLLRVPREQRPTAA